MRGVACSLKAQKRALAGVCVLVRAHVPTHVLSGSLATTHSLQTLSSSLALWRACSQPGLPGFRFDMNV